MNKSLLRPVLVISLSLITTASASAETISESNWPQWRGPLANGAAPNANPPIEWSETKNIKWKAALPGEGSSTPIIWGDRIFLTAAASTGKASDSTSTSASAQQPNTASPNPRGPGGGQGGPGVGGRRRGGGGGMFGIQKPTQPYRFRVLCLDRRTGKLLWEKVAREEVPHEGHHPTGTYAGASPVTDGQFVFAFFGSRGLYCFDLNGTLQWQKDFGKMRTKNSFGEGSSPALHGDRLVVNWDQEDGSFITALDKRTGKELWRQNRDEGTGWSTPLIVDHGGQAQVVVSATGKVRSYDLVTGKLLWEAGGQTANAIPSPVTAHGIVYVTSGFRGSTLQAIRLGKTGDLTGTDAIAWHYDRDTPYVPSPLLFDGKLYFLKVNSGLLSSVDAGTGQPRLAAERLPDIRSIYASPVGAKDRVYLVSREGTTLVVKNTDKLEVLATNKLDDAIDASPAIAGNELFLRSKQHLYCIAEK